MSDKIPECDPKQNGLEAIPGHVVHWLREFVANWVDDGRAKGYDSDPKIALAMDMYAAEFDAEPLILGNQLARAIQGGDIDQTRKLARQISEQNSIEAQEAACQAKRRNDFARQENHDLPRIDLVSSNNSVSAIEFTVPDTKRVKLSIEN